VSLRADGRSATPPDLAAPSDEVLAMDGAQWLLPAPTTAASTDPAPVERVEAARKLLTDPTVREGVRRRRALMLSETLATTDARARLLFLHGPPQARQPVDCNAVYVPLELWRYGDTHLVLYRPSPGAPFHLWLPVDGKRALYTHDMAGWLEEWAMLAGRVSGTRLDQRLCRSALFVDAATGVDGLGGQLPATPNAEKLLDLLAPPHDLAAWARAAAAEPVAAAKVLPIAGPLQTSFPRRDGQRVESRLLVLLPPDAPLTPAVEKKPDGSELRELRFDVDGTVETGRALLDAFRMRFTLPAGASATVAAPSAAASPTSPATPAASPTMEAASAPSPAAASAAKAAGPIVLAVPRPLRPGRYVVRLRIRDEVGGAQAVISSLLEVPEQPRSSPADSLIATEGVAGATTLDARLDQAEDSLVLLVPPLDVVFDSVRAQAVVKGNRIQHVAFLLDGVSQLVRTAPPWSVDIKLPRLPKEQVLRAEGYDAAGTLVASDQVVLNQLRGQLEVTILEPTPRAKLSAEMHARAQVVVPDERHVKFVEMRVNEELQAHLEKPPWEARIKVPAGDLAYLTVSAELDDGSTAEDVRILAAPSAMDQVQVELVELYTTVTDESTGELLRGLQPSDFAVKEDGRPQQLAKAELVEDLPLTVGVTLDISGSMQQALGEAQRAASDFLQSMIRPTDRCFAVAFNQRPTLVMPRTADAAAAAKELAKLKADGWTSLHDALAFSLYYFQGTRGRRALIVLSDGADTSSRLSFDEALTYAKLSGVVIYTVGLATEDLDMEAKSHLAKLAEQTGGRAFVIHKADELIGVYQRIEAELRSQYLLAYAPDKPAPAGDKRFRRVEVKVAKKGVVVRTIPGYTP
jgi:VWFA-related protein